MTAWYLADFFEICLSLARDLDALLDIDNPLHRPTKGGRESLVKYLHTRKTGKEMHINI